MHNSELQTWIDQSSHFSRDDVKVYHDVFTEMEVEAIDKHLERPNWRYGHYSSKAYGNAPPFWSMTLIEDKIFTNILINTINEITGVEHDILTVYANGQTYGQSGNPHQDAYDDSGRTFLWYANPWDVRWNGKTVFFTRDGYKFVVPCFNSAVYFPGMIPHYAEETTRTFGGLRKTIAWKLRVK